MRRSRKILTASAGAALGAAILALTACGGAPPDYTSATTCAARIVTGPRTSYLDGNGSPGFVTYVVVNDPLSQSPADCDADIRYEGEATPPGGDTVTIITALPKGLVQACAFGTGLFAWYGIADVTIYVTDFIYSESVSSGCVPSNPINYNGGVPAPYGPGGGS